MDKAMAQLEKGMKRRLLVVCGLMACGLSVLSARLVWLQIVEHEDYAAEAASHYTHREDIPASRGEIVDRNGDLLARNQTIYSIVADCQHLRDFGITCVALGRKENLGPRTIKQKYEPEEIVDQYLELVSENLAPSLRMPQGELYRRLNAKSAGEVVLARDVEEDAAQAFSAILNEHRIGGVYLRRNERRFYPSPLSLTHVIGYVDKDGVGKEGVEKVFDAEMRGEPGFRNVERDRRQREIHAFRGDEKEPKPGNGIRLTIDMSLQVRIEEVLDEVWEKYRPEKATAIWMDPRTGEVLAMASRPHFDLSTRQGNMRNVAVSDFYEPGSTFKIVAASAAFDRGLVTPTTEIFCHNGLYDEEGLKLKDHHPYGILTAEGVLAKSSNIGIYKIARQLNRGPFFEYLENFGFGRATGLEVTAETGGMLHPVSKWNQSSFSSMAMGYAVGVTPIQMATAYCAVANGGELLEPHVLKAIEDSRGRTLWTNRRNVVRRVMTEETSRMMRTALSKVTKEGGTGTNAALPGYDVAGKTGTAKKNFPGKGYIDGRYVVSFAGFLPANDPELVGLVVVDDPKAEGVSLYGGTIAAPIWAQMAGHAVRLRSVEPQDAETHRLAEIDPNQILIEGITD